MTREDFYKKKVLSDSEYNDISCKVDTCEEVCNDLICDMANVIKAFMNKLWEKAKEITFETDSYILIKHSDYVGIVDKDCDSSDERDIDEISDVDYLYEVIANLV